MKISDWIKNTSSTFKNAGIPTFQLDAELLLCHVLNFHNRVDIYLNEVNELTTRQSSQLDRLIKRRLSREPIAYILGQKDFYGRTFDVNKDVLIPRPESEDLIDLSKDLLSKKSMPQILDVGTGSGCIAITLALEIQPSNVSACDVSSAALKVAKHNSDSLGASIGFLQSDLLSSIYDKFDLIVANLPYVDSEWETSPETSFEPVSALYAANNGLDLIYRLIDESSDKISPNGYLILESDPRQHLPIKQYASANGLKYIKSLGYCLAFGN